MRQNKIPTTFRILIVEDDEIVSKYVKHVLSYSFDVVVISNIAEAKKYLKNGHLRIDCLVLDLYLPNGQGKDIISEFKEIVGDIPIIAYSGHLFESSEIIALGAEELLTKGHTSPEQLEKAITNAIGRYAVRKKMEPIEDNLKKIEASFL